ncbi:hypothetical protein WDZ92_40875, partial [Nostoc sp. NIES-2111]
MTKPVAPEHPVRLLVTGFGPYPGVPANPTGVLARGIAASPRLRLAGIGSKAKVFETTYAGIGKALGKALERGNPDVCLHLGLAPRARQVRIEVRAENRARPLAPDASGARPASRAIVPSGPADWRTPVSVPPVVAALRRAGVAAAASRDAGAYLCNAVYGLSLDAARCRQGRLVLFVHIPRPAPPAGRLPSPPARLRARAKPRLDPPAAAATGVATPLRAGAPTTPAPPSAPTPRAP